MLQRLREGLGLSEDFVERELRLHAGEMGRIERGEEAPESALIDALGDLYGVSAADLVTGTIEEDLLAPVQVLLRKQVGEIPQKVRSEIARVASARRDVKELELELDQPDRYKELRRRFMHEGAYGDQGEEWVRGKELAERLRDFLGLSTRDPIPSVRDTVKRLGIEIVAVALDDGRVAGFSLADPYHGPAIVINLRGANANIWVRRFTVAHELCHVLHDELTHEALSPVQMYDDEGGPGSIAPGPEPRANAFAAHFLAPDDAVRSFLLSTGKTKSILAEQIRALMEHFGINFRTARYRAIHTGWASAYEVDALRGVPPAPRNDDPRIAAEALPDFDLFPCPSIPFERRGKLSRLVAEAWSRGLMDRGQAIEMLRAAPDEPLEMLAELAGA